MHAQTILKRYDDFGPSVDVNRDHVRGVACDTIYLTGKELLSIESVNSAHFDGLDKLYKQSVSLNKKGFIQNLAFHGDITELAMRYQQEGGDFVAGLLNGHVVAMGGLRIARDGQSAELCKLHVDPDYQGQGYGRLLCQYILDRAIEKKIQLITLHVTVSQHAALNLYQSLGFLTDKIELCVIEFQGERMEFETAFLSKTL